MLLFFLQSVVATFVVLSALCWTASAFTKTASTSSKWVWRAAGCAAIAIVAEVAVLFVQRY